MATIDISDKLYKDLTDFTVLNELEFSGFVEKCLKDGFIREKYGMAGTIKTVKEKKKIKERPKNNCNNDFSEEYLS